MKSLISVYAKIKGKMQWSKLKEQRGATMVEYALMVALIAVAAVVSVQTLSTKIQTKFGDVGTAITDAK